MNDKNDILDAKAAAQLLGAHVETIRRLARKGELPGYKIGKDWRFRKESLLSWSTGLRQKKEAPTVLVIDDDAGFRKLVGHYLEEAGYRVCSAREGSEGLIWLDRCPVQLILLDLNMKGMNGPAFLRVFREQQRNIPVIVLSGFPDGALMAEAIQYGPFTMLAKPVDRKALMAIVDAGVKCYNGT